MQQYTEIPGQEIISASLGDILNNDKTALSCSSGSAFPTQNLQQGMLCLRTDLNQLFQMQDANLTAWVLIADLGRHPLWQDNPLVTGTVSVQDGHRRIKGVGNSSLSLESDEYGILSSSQDVQIAQNAWWDGTNWQRYDTSRPAAAVLVSAGVPKVYIAAAGNNPIAWNTYSIYHTGNFDPTTKADKNNAQLTGTPTAPTPPAASNDQTIPNTQWTRSAILGIAPLAAISGTVSIVAADFPSFKYATADTTINLPAANTVPTGLTLTIKNAGNWNVKIYPTVNGGYIDGVNGWIRVPGWDTLELMSIGTQWVRVRGADQKVGQVLPGFTLMEMSLGYAQADGRAISRTQFSGLFDAFGTTFGAGDGSTTFNLPTVAGRALVGVGQGNGLTNRNLGDLFGEETHLLSLQEIPSHNHGNGIYTRLLRPPYGGSLTGGDTTGSGSEQAVGPGDSADIQAQGGGQAHNNMQPSIATYMFIKT